MYQSRAVQSNQSGVHDNLITQLEKHLKTAFQKPVADHTRQAFSVFEAGFKAFDGQKLILDACCGVGDSSRKIAGLYPDHYVVGVDRSEDRLSRQRGSDVDEGVIAENLLLVRADLMDFYRLLQAGEYRLTRHYILYPNPYPKASQLGKRWHGSPAFPVIVALGGQLDVRSNWSIYIEEFGTALSHVGVVSEEGQYQPENDEYWTLFEKKYHQSGQDLWHLTADLDARQQGELQS